MLYIYMIQYLTCHVYLGITLPRNTRGSHIFPLEISGDHRASFQEKLKVSQASGHFQVFFVVGFRNLEDHPS